MNKLYGLLMRGSHPKLYTSRYLIDYGPEVYSEFRRALMPGTDPDYHAYCAWQLIDLVKISSYGSVLSVVDPINTYDTIPAPPLSYEKLTSTHTGGTVKVCTLPADGGDPVLYIRRQGAGNAGTNTINIAKGVTLQCFDVPASFTWDLTKIIQPMRSLAEVYTQVTNNAIVTHSSLRDITPISGIDIIAAAVLSYGLSNNIR